MTTKRKVLQPERDFQEDELEQFRTLKSDLEKSFSPDITIAHESELKEIAVSCITIQKLLKRDESKARNDIIRQYQKRVTQRLLDMGYLRCAIGRRWTLTRFE